MNAGDRAVFHPTAITGDGGTWLSVTPDIATTPTSLTVSVDPTGLKAGTYYGLIGIVDPAGDIPTSFVPVSLQISDGAILGVPSQQLVFNTQTGVGAIQSQQIVVNAVGSSSSFHATTYGGSWLTVDPADGVASGVINVTPKVDGLAPGYYLGGVWISIPNVVNSQQFVPVVLVISPGF
jgi:hypothetical protein